ncbi:cobalt ECF transporter T component CbiQ [Clostridium luticellarii]|jgi:cobalt/nickel transport system permease protein|uniref:Cobalt transport protein CbiQ n=1 Tax=Clostridium luticellarii TaxID=1691940 RepID=A0A2T0BEX1_9CLOT|nr:cobalt ECF transporter T component CbiQ [Clostridium luticellarii]MCI1944839.1 cobalt ECF transporter T component CbiQ [Clostridium luticellarii]MCI1968345.1 cobalt ECF transporter T component CbiQ [Clostridium luticellarii]MCI1995343.1 cobalt ECF transporter T component CbiQ [Clostridium luticellarii]MCI2039395.1 cobalt ECF transporter T component CbiQ [Clostridium luticellarii]PRR82367.1 Cobalt transport protein CbiQ [Clostridium luticellarii]
MELSSFGRISGNKSFLHRLDGRVKTVLFLSAIIIVTFLTKWYLIVFLWILSIIGYYTLGIPWKRLIKRLLIPFSIAWLVFVSVLFTNGENVLTYIPLGAYHLNIYREGIAMGTLLMLRIMAAVSVACILSFCTPMIEILETLRILKMPSIIIDLADMMYRYIFIIEDTGKNMRHAQLSRMGDRSSWMRGVGDTAKIGVYVIIESLDRSVRIYNAMLSRGYNENSEQAKFFTYSIPRKDFRFGISGAALLVVLIIANIFI